MCAEEGSPRGAKLCGRRVVTRDIERDGGRDGIGKEREGRGRGRNKKKERKKEKGKGKVRG